MSENREEILADFQACTGIEDVAEAIYHLDEANWDLLRAVSRVMPPDTQSFRPPAVEPVDPDVMIVEDDADIPSAATADAASDMVVVGNSLGHSSTVTKKANTPDDSFPSTSAGKSGSRMLKFNVQYCDRVVKVELPESATVNDLKLKLHREVKVNPCRQLLSSWARLAQYEDTPFSKLMLPGDNSLHLTVKPSDGAFTSDEENAVSEKLRGTYTLNVKYENKTFNLKYQGTKTILEVKGDVYTLTNIHVRNQVWSGWPPNIDDNTVLALSGINYPEHDLSVRRSTQSVREKKSMPVVQIDSDDDEFEDASESFTVDDEYFVDNEGANAKRTDPLIPEDVEDEIVGCITFAEQFTTRYGPVHPAFYQGTLDDAIKEACSKPAKDDLNQSHGIIGSTMPSILKSAVEIGKFYNGEISQTIEKLDDIAKNADVDKPYDLFGNYVASELHQLPKRAAILLQQDIQNCITRAKLNLLNAASSPTDSLINRFCDWFFKRRRGHRTNSDD